MPVAERDKRRVWGIVIDANKTADDRNLLLQRINDACRSENGSPELIDPSVAIDLSLMFARAEITHLWNDTGEGLETLDIPREYAISIAQAIADTEKKQDGQPVYDGLKKIMAQIGIQEIKYEEARWEKRCDGALIIPDRSEWLEHSRRKNEAEGLIYLALSLPR